jgi:hypothetical protein
MDCNQHCGDATLPTVKYSDIFRTVAAKFISMQRQKQGIKSSTAYFLTYKGQFSLPADGKQVM